MIWILLIVNVYFNLITSIPVELDKRMEHGIEADKSVFPWIATMHRSSSESGNSTKFCTGSFLSHDLVLTAAHCMKSNGGRISVIKTNQNPPVEYEYIDGIHHSQFIPLEISPDGRGDIALLKVRKKNSKDPNIPVFPKFASHQDLQYSLDKVTNRGYIARDATLMAAGHGRNITSDADTPVKVMSVLETDANTCAQYLKKNNRYFKDAEQQVTCYASLDNVSRNCEGDSGGPLFEYYNDNPVIRGVFTFADRDGHCAVRYNSMYPSVAMNVRYYSSFILESIKKLKE
jgi:secreted trypsin-like serine protease